MSQKKVDEALKGIDNALKKGVGILNSLSENAFKGTVLEEKPLDNVGLIVARLLQARNELEEKARYEGKSDTEIAELKEQEIQQERDDFQRQMAEKLEEYAEKKKPKPVKPAGDGQPAESEVNQETDADQDESAV